MYWGRNENQNGNPHLGIVNTIAAIAIFVLEVAYILYTALATEGEQHKKSYKRDIRKNSWS